MAFFSTTTPKYLPWLFLSNYRCTLCSSWSHPASVWIAVLSVKVMIKLLTPVTTISSLLYLVSEFTIKFIRAEIYLYLSSRVHCLHKNFHFSAKHFDFGICSVDKKISIFLNHLPPRLSLCSFPALHASSEKSGKYRNQSCETLIPHIGLCNWGIMLDTGNGRSHFLVFSVLATV